MIKIYPKSKLTKRRETLDSVAEVKQYGRAIDVLENARRCWDRLERFRKDRDRNYRYARGDQWSDKINVDGRTMTEEAYMLEQGNVPITNNLTHPLIRTTIGVYRRQNKIPSCSANAREEQGLGDTMTVALQKNWKDNEKIELDSRVFDEYLVSGMAIEKEVWAMRGDREDVYTYAPNPNYFFFDDSMADVRNWDINIIGELHDLTMKEVLHTFAKSPAEARALKELYAKGLNELSDIGDLTQRNKLQNISFTTPWDSSLCRVIEIWTKEIRPRYWCHDVLKGELYKVEIADKAMIDRQNEELREEAIAHGMDEEDIPYVETEWFMDTFWYCRFMAPTGEVIAEFESPYEHNEHPYVMKLYPYTNGEIHSFTADVIPQQRYINRMISLNDKLIRSSAKGVLLYPTSKLPKNKTIEDVLREWTRPDSVLEWDDTNTKSDAMPTQIANKLTNIGIGEMLQLEISLMNDITGVNGALQGKPGFAGQSAALYNQQTQNASTAILDVLDSFGAFVLAGAKKKVKLMQQFYTDKRIINIAGKRQAALYDPARMGDVDFDLTIGESVDSPTSRMVANDLLMELFKMQAINVKQLLEYGDFPFSDGLLEAIKADEVRMQQGQAPQGIPQELQQQVAEGADQGAIEQAQRYLKGQ